MSFHFLNVNLRMFDPCCIVEVFQVFCVSARLRQAGQITCCKHVPEEVLPPIWESISMLLAAVSARVEVKYPYDSLIRSMSLCFMLAASGPSPSAKPTAETDKKVAGGVPAGGVGPIGDVDYTDIPNTQIRRVRMFCTLESRNMCCALIEN